MSSSIKDECSICERPIDVKEDLVITDCLHIFHRDCAQKRVDERNRTDCHICHKDSALAEALREPATTNKICTICEEVWFQKEDLVMTSCHHVFHRDCAQKRLDTRKKTDCHVCHKDFALRDALLRQVTFIEY
jgi:Ring finger domain/RING-type zinc-finger